MHKDDSTVSFQDEVGATGQIGLVQSKAVAESVDEAANGDFGSGVFGADPGHVAGALFRSVHVGHGRSFVGGCVGGVSSGVVNARATIVNGFSGDFCGIACEF